MVEARDIKWDQSSIEEVRRWLTTPEISEDEIGEIHHLDYPWPVNLLRQEVVWGSAKDCTVIATLGFEEVPFAEDYEIRITLLPDLPPSCIM